MRNCSIWPISISQEVFDEDAPQKRARKDHPPVVSGVKPSRPSAVAKIAKAARDKPNWKQKALPQPPANHRVLI